MGSNTDEVLVADIARTVIATMAPAEKPIFGALSEAYFADPARALAGGGERGPLRMGDMGAVLLLTPVALAAATEVTQYLVGEVLRPAVARGGSAVRRLFGVGAVARRHRPVLIPLAALVCGVLATAALLLGVETLGRCADLYGVGPQPCFQLPRPTLAAGDLHAVVVEGAAAVPGALLGAVLGALLARRRAPGEADTDSGRRFRWAGTAILTILFVIVVAAAVVEGLDSYQVWMR